jgi:hypothetical protein
MSISKLPFELGDYAQKLSEFERRGNNLARRWLDEPDHVAIKAFNSRAYESLLAQVEAQMEVDDNIIVAELNERRIATAFLTGGLAVGEFGEVHMLEIMEPRPERVGKDKVGLDHVEFLVTDLVGVQRHLRRGQVSFEHQVNSSHEFVSVRFGESHEHEVKFTDTSLADIVKT